VGFWRFKRRNLGWNLRPLLAIEKKEPWMESSWASGNSKEGKLGLNLDGLVIWKGIDPILKMESEVQS
jgi:hypothetical protein